MPALRITRHLAVSAIALALCTSSPLMAQAAAPAGFRASVLTDVDNLSTKFSGLAGAMTGKYDWKPGTGVRSAGEVFNLIVMENKMLLGTLTGAAAPQGAPPAAITDPAQLQEALKSSYAALRTAVAALPEADMSTSIRLFGRDMTKQGALYMLLADQHEHLGQAIAYARSNNVVPPWSQRPR